MKTFIARCGASFRRARLAYRIARARRRPTVASVERLASRLIALRRFEDAESLVRRGLERAPRHPDLLQQLAFCAHNAGHHREALERWRDLCALRPDMPMPWVGIGSNARELQLLDVAAAAMQEALARFPDDFVVISEAARLHETRRAFAEAADLWGRMVFEHPTPDAGWRVDLARNLMRLHRFDEVERALAELPPPGDAGSARRAAAITWGRIAEVAAEMRRADLALFMTEAVRRYGDDAFAAHQLAETTDDLVGARETVQRLLSRSGEDVALRTTYVRLLIRLDLVDDAEREIELALGLASEPDHGDLLALRGQIAMRRLDWDAAKALWAARAKTNPGDLTAALYVERLERIRQLHRPDATSGAARPVPLSPEVCDDPEVRRLLLGYESIGADCEFGIVQRRYGAEPLALLRWTDTDIPSLMAASAACFEGIGDPAFTELMVGPFGEIYTRDTRWHLAMHTFLFETEVSLAALLPKMCRRTAYLRDKFLGDLRGAEKTLVFKSENVDRGELLALHDALLAFGRVRLLHVRLASGSRDFEAEEPGSVREIRTDLLVGRVSRFDHAHCAYEDWVAVCRAAQRPGDASDAREAADALLPAA